MAGRSKAVVTGASSGIGAAIARRLAADGAHVLLVARDPVTLEDVAADIRSAGGTASVFAVDLIAEHAAEAVVASAQETMGGLDILVNCASLTQGGNFFDISDAQWQRAFEVKVFGATRLCRAAWPLLREGKGSIVNICGIGARTPKAVTAVTAATSSAMLAITKVLAQIGVGDDVQVNAINPGLIRTPRTEQSIGGEQAEAAWLQQVGATRAGEPEDVASLVAYIVSPAGSLLHGALIDLDGGATKGL